MSDSKKSKPISYEKVITVSFLVDISDVIINIIVAAVSGSTTMLSQTLQGAVDLLSSGFLYLGAKRAKRPPDKFHPFGYGREIYFWTFLTSLIMFTITSSLSFYWGLIRFLHPEDLEHIPLAYAALIVAFLTNGYAFSLSFKRLMSGKKKHILRHIFSSSRIETKTTAILDLMGTLASVFGLMALLIYQITGNGRFDGIGAMSVGVLIAGCSLFILRDVKNLLIGKAASAKIRYRIIRATTSFPEVNSVLDLRTSYIGTDKLFIAMEIHVVDRLDTDKIEQLIDNIEQKIKHKVSEAGYIHIELEAPD